MRQTFSDLIKICQDGAGKDTSTASLTFFKQRINSRDETVLSKLPSYLSEIEDTFTTVADQQPYDYFANTREIVGLSIEINSVTYNLTPIHSNARWNQLNAIQIQAGAIPLHYFKRQRKFEIWPIPQDAYTATMQYSIRGGGMVRTDYTTGTVTATVSDATVEGAGGMAWDTTTNILAGDWFTLTDSNGEPRGEWYRVDSITDADTLELNRTYERSTEAGATYLIGQTPEGPEEGHEFRAHGALMDYFLAFRQSPAKAKVWANMFWTGDPGISRQVAVRESKPWTGGGLLGLINDYTDRESSQLIERRPDRGDPRMKVFATQIS